jgi:Rrf2 family protein
VLAEKGEGGEASLACRDGSRPEAFEPGTRLRRVTAKRGGDGRSSLMNVGRRVDYALRALCYLAAQDGRTVSRSEIQLRQGVPPHFLSKILRRLVAKGLLESVPGARGGFRLGQPSGEISVRQVYECVEGSLCLIDCLEQDGFCHFTPVCTQRDIWRGAQRVLLEYLDGISLGAIADRQGLVCRLEATRDGPVARRAGRGGKVGEEQ